MSTPDFDLTPHTEMWQKFLRWAGITTVFVAILVTIVVRVITA